MPTPDSSEFTRRQKLLIQQALSTDIAKRNYFTNSYAYPVSAVSLSNFLSSIQKLVAQPDSTGPIVPTYSVSSNIATVGEGSSITFTVSTANVADGTTLYWTTSGTATASDFSDNTDNGSVTIVSNTATIVRSLKTNANIGDGKTFNLSIRLESITGEIVAQTGTITVADTTPTYGISASVSSVNEGASVTFTVTTANVADGTVLYWTNSGTTTSADFDDNANSGSVTITSGSGTIVRAVLLDAVASENETVILQLRTGSTSGTVVATSGTVTVVDKTAIYAVSEGTSSVNEGSAVTFTITTVNVADGTILYWTNSGTTTSADFNDNANDGTVTITSNSGTVTRTLIVDDILSETETVILQVRTGSVSGSVVATSGTVNVVDKSPSYSISASASSVDEGASVTFTVTTTNVADGTILYWTNSGTTTSADFDDNANSGSVTITSNSGTITRTLLLDAVGLETETVILQLRTGSVSGTVVATSGTVSVVDKTVVYAVSASSATVNEGSSVTFTITTANVANGTTLYWTTDGTAVAADFTDSETSGSFTITSGSGSVVRTLTLDYVTEGSETFSLSVRTGSTSGTVVATSETVTINDTPLQYTWTEQTSSPAQRYSNMDMTSDGNTVISTQVSSTSGSQGPYVSTDGGATWALKASGITLLTSGDSYTADVAVASANGSIMYAAQRRTGSGAASYDKIYKSTDGGNNWTATTAPDSTWECIACSSDGQVVLAGNSASGNVSFNGRWAISTNGGTTWTAGDTTGTWVSVAMSSNGTRMYARSGGAITNLYRSSDTGSTWTTTTNSVSLRTLACSANGINLLAGRGSTSRPVLSTNGGVTLTQISSLPSGNWDITSVSADGTVMAVGRSSNIGSFYISIDSGVNWFQQSALSSANWVSAAINTNGSKIIAGPISGKPYVGVP
jgi:membrane protein insertase Oxa1/YidC/SpoIIIJ